MPDAKNGWADRAIREFQSTSCKHQHPSGYCGATPRTDSNGSLRLFKQQTLSIDCRRPKNLCGTGETKLVTFFWENPRAGLGHDPEILEGIGRGPYAIWWANRAEERGESLSGVDIYEAAPRTTTKAKKWAREVADEIVRLNNKSLSELYDLAQSYGYDRDREYFGVDLGGQTTGEGISWTDRADFRRLPREEPIRLPHREFYL